MMTISSDISHIPVIDFSLFHTDIHACAKQILDAAENVGFFYLRNFGLNRNEVQDMFALSKEFFAQPKEEKHVYAITKDNIGYSSVRQEAVDPQHYAQGDYKESFHIAKFKQNEPGQDLPPVFDTARIKVDHFVKTCHTIVSQIMECLAIALEIPESEGGRAWFSSRHKYEMPSNDVLRLLHYPPLEHASETDDIRIGRHSDYGSLTLLFQNGVAGLQIQANRDDDKEIRWLDAPVLEDCLTVNLGDCLEYWTNGLLRSTKHRVVFTPETQMQPRYSMAYFCQGGQAVLEPVPSRFITKSANEEKERAKDEAATPPLTAAKHLEMRLNATYSAY
ncbi:oxidoreductase [Lichtheimia corymbifera JMRC:FSU:9682]|uniref:Oxidoreductase n=1 Tax=Lichtheimia corymbifera JMRC:FSU:9682 TaxID=1263082 RepID=A0A068SD58_9FUNG|nr:oxidoreductase [Lichtheimia corymbifera JMRC:FSU:9682]